LHVGTKDALGCVHVKLKHGGMIGPTSKKSATNGYLPYATTKNKEQRD
jgi:hypothetical protein